LSIHFGFEPTTKHQGRSLALSGPALNILMKLMAIISLVFADFFVSVNHA